MAKAQEEMEVVDAETDAKGNTYLPGSAPKVIKPLVEMVKTIENELKPAFASARNNLVAGQEKLSELAHKHIEYFSEADENGRRVYEAGGVRVEIVFEKEKIKTAVIEDE